jgi:uncharacterized membrane protein
MTWLRRKVDELVRAVSAPPAPRTDRAPGAGGTRARRRGRPPEPVVAHAHAHTHAATPTPPAVRRHARHVFVVVLVPALLLTAYGMWQLWPHGERPTIETTGPGQTYLTATVVKVGAVSDAESSLDTEALAQIRVAGHVVPMDVPPEYVTELAPGDRVQVVHLSDVMPGAPSYVFVDFERGPPLALLAVAFVALVLLVARWRGLAALGGLLVALVVISRFTLPALVLGEPAVWVALMSSSAIMFVVLYLVHGFTLRTSTALAGTLAGLVATAAIAAWASGAAHLTGLSDEYALDLRSAAHAVSVREVLLAGMVLAGLGVLNDVTITQASAVWELHAADTTATRRVLFRRAMRIGRDHIASTIYTIAFAYIGASLPLVLLVSISDRTLLGSLGSGELAEEVARTLVGSVGLVLAIPLTTLVAALVVASGRPSHATDPDGTPPDDVERPRLSAPTA